MEEKRQYQTFKGYEFCISKCFSDPSVYELVVVKLNKDFIEENFIEHEEFEEFNDLKKYLILHYDLEIFEKDFKVEVVANEHFLEDEMNKKVNVKLSLREIRAIAIILYLYETIGKNILLFLQLNSDLYENKKDYQEFLKEDFLENIQDKLMKAKQGEK